MFIDEMADRVRRILGWCFHRVDDLPRPFELLAALDGELRSIAWLTETNDDCAIGIFDVLQCAIGETPLLHFSKRVAVRNFPKLIEPPGRTPSAAMDSVLERDVESGAVNASLSTGNDFHREWQGRRAAAPRTAQRAVPTSFHPASDTISRLRAKGLKFVPRS